MSRSCSTGVSYRLRAAQPSAVRGCGGKISEYVLQSFGAEKRETLSYRVTDSVLQSVDFIGLRTSGDYESASYQGTNYVSSTGEIILTGQEVKLKEFVDEDMIPGLKDFLLTL